MAEVQIIEVHLYELPNQQYVFKGTFHPKKNDISIFSLWPVQSFMHLDCRINEQNSRNVCLLLNTRIKSSVHKPYSGYFNAQCFSLYKSATTKHLKATAVAIWQHINKTELKQQ